MPPLGTPLAHPAFTLDSSAVAGFFGGEEAISAMATVHLYKYRRWLGWYNSPGSYTIAKRFGTMAKGPFWDGLFPGPNQPPAVLFGLDVKKGPRYIAALSGTTMYTGHLAYLTMERSKEVKEVVPVGDRKTTPCDVVYLAMKHFDYDTPVKPLPLTALPLGVLGAMLAPATIIVSLATCIMCALVYDWFSFSMILIGIISSSFASAVIGCGRVEIKSAKEPAEGAPPGHGILMGEDGVVVIKGEERDVNVITKGRFTLETDPKKGGEGDRQGDEGKKQDDEKKQGDDGKQGDKGEKQANGGVQKYHWIGVSSLLLLVQFLVQLLLVPQGTLFGQIMFLGSLGISWAYNSYLSSLEKEKIQTEILFRSLGNPEMRRFCAGTRTTMAVFVCLLLFHGVKPSDTKKDHDLRVKILHECIPNDTEVWKRWREKVVQQLLDIREGDEGDKGDRSDKEPHPLPFLTESDQDPKFSEESDRQLFTRLLQDARSAFDGYFVARGNLPDWHAHAKIIRV